MRLYMYWQEHVSKDCHILLFDIFIEWSEEYDTLDIQAAVIYYV